MADYSRYKTDTLKRMKEKAYEKYAALNSQEDVGWGAGMRYAKLPSLAAWEKARERYYAICAELEKRRKTEMI